MFTEVFTNNNNLKKNHISDNKTVSPAIKNKKKLSHGLKFQFFFSIIRFS